MSSVVNAQNAIECLNISDDDQFQEVSPGRSAAPSAYLKKGSLEMENLRNVSFQPDLFTGKCYCSISGEKRQVSELSVLSAQLF